MSDIAASALVSALKKIADVAMAHDKVLMAQVEQLTGRIRDLECRIVELEMKLASGGEA